MTPMRYVVLVDVGRGSNWVRPEAERLSAALNLHRSYPTLALAEARAAFLGGPPVFRACSEEEAAALLRPVNPR
jgi:hypothetical protein